MNKLKKVSISFWIFITGLITKVSAFSLKGQTKYGVFDPGMIEDKYGVYDPVPTSGEKISSVGKYVIPIILFFIGLFVVLSKKLTKKVKAIIISGLVILAILGYILMKYLATYY